MEVFTRPGFSIRSKKYPDFSETYLMDDQVYIVANQFNRDVRIDSPTSDHFDIAYLLDFLQQPLDRVVWEIPSVFRNDSLPNILYVNSGGCTSQIDTSKGMLLRQEVTHAGIVGQQIFPIDFFVTSNNLWLPRVILSIQYFPYDALTTPVKVVYRI